MAVDGDIVAGAAGGMAGSDTGLSAAMAALDLLAASITDCRQYAIPFAHVAAGTGLDPVLAGV